MVGEMSVVYEGVPIWVKYEYLPKRDDWDWTAFIGEVVVNKILSIEVRREISRMVMDRIQQRFDLGVWK
jgi:hypothetical protein